MRDLWTADHRGWCYVVGAGQTPLYTNDIRWKKPEGRCLAPLDPGLVSSPILPRKLRLESRGGIESLSSPWLAQRHRWAWQRRHLRRMVKRPQSTLPVLLVSYAPTLLSRATPRRPFNRRVRAEGCPAQSTDTLPGELLTVQPRTSLRLCNSHQVVDDNLPYATWLHLSPQEAAQLLPRAGARTLG